MLKNPNHSQPRTALVSLGPESMLGFLFLMIACCSQDGMLLALYMLTQTVGTLLLPLPWTLIFRCAVCLKRRQDSGDGSGPSMLRWRAPIATFVHAAVTCETCHLHSTYHSPRISVAAHRPPHPARVLLGCSPVRLTSIFHCAHSITCRTGLRNHA